MKINVLMSGLFVLGLTACGNRQAQPSETSKTSQVSVVDSTASTNIGNVPVNQSKLVSKGIIQSVTDVAIYTEIHKKVIMSNLKEGQLVQKGQLLVRLDDEEIRAEIEKARNEFEQTKYRYADILVGQGYKHDALDQAPQKVQEQAKIKCNYQAAKLNLEIAQKQMSKTVVTAPCSGAITQVKVHQYDTPNGEAICHILDPNHLKVVFHVLETELKKVEKGKTVNVTSVSYPDEAHEATVTAVSVSVDENGMLEIEATLKDTTHLLPGMTAIVNF